ncbi:MAG: YggS family pyridoxal phosphate-dependent enzyme [Gemmatimonadetes bacterium]|nr:YggS family pyridoxal phosphate-dependent enzyme [Gemmatimonadota bacterium]
MTSDGIDARLAGVIRRVERAAERAGRSPDEVEILPVTKGHSADAIRSVAAAGLRAIGENRVPEAEAKRAEIGPTPGVAWHMIGRLQRNKARRAVRLFDAIESVDSVRLAETLHRIVCEEERDPVDVLVQVNTADESAKTGFRSDEAVSGARAVAELSGLRVAGLMMMAPFTSDEGVLRSAFREASRLFERCRDEIPKFEGRTLSMGMSNDFELAVEEGSTRVRLGTVILGER